MNKRETAIQQARKKQITEAAIMLFSQSGYDSVSIDRIAEKAGLSKGAIYWYWRSKKDIAFEIYLSTRKQYLDIINTTSSEPGDILSKLDRIQSRISDNLIDNPQRYKMISNLWADRNRIFSSEDIEVLLGMFKKIHESIKNMLDEGVSAGIFKPVDTMFFAHFIFSAFDGLDREWFDVGKEFPLKKAYQMMFELVKNHLVKT